MKNRFENKTKWKERSRRMEIEGVSVKGVRDKRKGEKLVILERHVDNIQEHIFIHLYSILILEDHDDGKGNISLSDRMINVFSNQDTVLPSPTPHSPSSFHFSSFWTNFPFPLFQSPIQVCWRKKRNVVWIPFSHQPRSFSYHVLSVFYCSTSEKNIQVNIEEKEPKYSCIICLWLPVVIALEEN